MKPLELTQEKLATSPEFWLNLQYRNEIWEALHNRKRKIRIDRVKRLAA